MKRKLDPLNEYEENSKVDQTPSNAHYARDDVNRFQSIKDLRNKVKSNTDVAFRELISDHTFVGSIDREFSLIQHSTSLYVANTPAISRQLFYQIILADFGNFNAIRLHPPVSISSLAKLALDDTGIVCLIILWTNVIKYSFLLSVLSYKRIYFCRRVWLDRRRW